MNMEILFDVSRIFKGCHFIRCIVFNFYGGSCLKKRFRRKLYVGGIFTFDCHYYTKNLILYVE